MMKYEFTLIRTKQIRKAWDSPFTTVEGSETRIRVFAQSQADAIDAASKVSGEPPEYGGRPSRYVYQVTEISEIHP